MKKRVTTRTTQIMNPHLQISKCGINMVILQLHLCVFLHYSYLHIHLLLLLIFTVLGGGEEDLLKQSSLGPTLTCQMTKSKFDCSFFCPQWYSALLRFFWKANASGKQILLGRQLFPDNPNSSCKLYCHVTFNLLLNCCYKSLLP